MTRARTAQKVKRMKYGLGMALATTLCIAAAVPARAVTFPMQGLLMGGIPPAAATERDELIAAADHRLQPAGSVVLEPKTKMGKVTVLQVVSPKQWAAQYPAIASDVGAAAVRDGGLWLVEIQDAAGAKIWIQGSAIWIPCLGGQLGPNGIQPPTKDCVHATGAVPK